MRLLSSRYPQNRKNLSFWKKLICSSKPSPISKFYMSEQFFAYLILCTLKITKSRGPSIVYFSFPWYPTSIRVVFCRFSRLKRTPKAPNPISLFKRHLGLICIPWQDWNQVYKKRKAPQYFQGVKIYLAFSRLEDSFCSLFGNAKN